MKVTLNGELHEVQKDTTITVLLNTLNLGNSTVAVAINGEFVPRGQYPEHYIAVNDVIDVVAPMQGG